MGCASSTEAEKQEKKNKKKKLEENATSGYTIHEFVRDHLVPVDGFIYKKDYYEKLKNGQAAAQRHHWEDAAKVCYCMLHSTEINTDTRAAAKIDKAFDFNQDSALPIYVNGFLFFPPEKPIEEKVIKGKEKEAQSTAKDSNKVKLAVRVEAQLSKSETELDPGETGHGGDDLRILCTNMEIPKSEDKDGDAVVDSWLPADDVLHGIEKLLESKLKDMLRGQGN
mmetsp:Transcript_10561/g.19193  ORF Transcript_10561/g.19193 Transcript_10561/m.19193 type:complete len:224 (+) Transcript_10561:32-703(+)